MWWKAVSLELEQDPPQTTSSTAWPASKGRITGAVASSASAERLASHGIKLFDLNDVTEMPIYVDGADEIDASLAMIKGGGGALTREKIVAAVSAVSSAFAMRANASR